MDWLDQIAVTITPKRGMMPRQVSDDRHFNRIARGHLSDPHAIVRTNQIAADRIDPQEKAVRNGRLGHKGFVWHGGSAWLRGSHGSHEIIPKRLKDYTISSY
jgi:hypothetical protein